MECNAPAAGTRIDSVESPKIPLQEEWDVIAAQQKIWCARRDSNSRPVAPEATALSS
jgi:hypothetical protein